MALTASVQVDRDARGKWHVAPSTVEQEHATCATLTEAQDLAYRWAGDHRPCELIVRDAYHRIARREVVDGPST